MKVETRPDNCEVLDGSTFTPQERAQFDYLNWDAIDKGTDSASFFRLNGEIYDLGNFMRVELGGELDRTGWHGIHSTSAWTADVVRYTQDNEAVITGFVTVPFAR